MSTLEDAAAKAIAALKYYHSAEVRIALDPAVSSDAQALIDRGKAEAPTAEPVAWMHNQRVDCIHNEVKELLKRAGGHLHRPLDKTENYTIPLYTHPPEPVAWTPVTTRRPPWDERKVVCYTEGYDYGGSQFITMPASDFHCYDEDDPDEPGSRESKTVSHWIYEDDLVRAVLAHGRKG